MFVGDTSTDLMSLCSPDLVACSVVPDAAPQNFGVEAVETNPEMLMLTWRPVPEGSRNGMIRAYVYRCNSSDASEETVSTEPDLETTNGMYSQLVSGLESNTYYSCQVRARNVVGDGPAAHGTALTGNVS